MFNRRKRRRRIVQAWKPEYDLLARYNSDRARGIVFDRATVDQMAAVQRDYDKSYPANVWIGTAPDEEE